MHQEALDEGAHLIPRERQSFSSPMIGVSSHLDKRKYQVASALSTGRIGALMLDVRSMPEADPPRVLHCALLLGAQPALKLPGAAHI